MIMIIMVIIIIIKINNEWNINDNEIIMIKW